MTHHTIKKARQIYKLWSWRKIRLVISHNIVAHYNPVRHTYIVDETVPIQWIIHFYDNQQNTLAKIYILAMYKDIQDIYKYITN